MSNLPHKTITVTLCTSRRHPHLPTEGMFSKTPDPSGNSNKASHISFNFLVLQNPFPLPQEIPIPSVEGVQIFSGHTHFKAVHVTVNN